jgi:putative ABC transport system permease protein
VLPKEFYGSYITSDADVWTCIATHEQVRPRGIPLDTPGWRWLNLTGILNENTSLKIAQAELDHLAGQLQLEFPQVNQGLRLRITKATAVPEALSNVLTRAIRFLSFVGGLVLLVVCANIAGALLPQVVARSRENAIRTSLGASQSRLIRQWLTESFVLSLFGGCAGILVALWCREGFKVLLPSEWQVFIPSLSLDRIVLVFAMLISFLTAILCGLTPVFQLRKSTVSSALKGESQGVPRYRLFGMFVSTQISISLLLLIIAALLLRSLSNSSSFDLGFDTRNLLLATIDTRRHSMTDERGRQFFEELISRLKKLPGVRSSSYAMVTPLDNARESQGFEILFHNVKRTISVACNSVGRDYFETMGIPLQSGRSFSEKEIAGQSPSAAIVNETAAKTFWPNSNPIGQRIRLVDGPQLEIVGVAKNIQYYTIGETLQPYIYLTPNVVYIGQMTIHVRTTTPAEDLQQMLIREIAGIDPNVAPFQVMQFTQLRHLQLFPVRILATISTLIGLLAVILTALGVYGVVSYGVNKRSKEIGVRLALGASRNIILHLILQQGLTFILIGCAAGLVGAFAVTRFLSAILFQISPTDILTFICAPAFLLFIAVFASLLPARRAIKIDPMIVLRYE